MIKRVFYASAGPADLIAAHRSWKAGAHLPTEVSVTFSEQIEAWCEEIGADAWFVSVHPDGERLEDGRLTIEHRPKRRRGGLGYHLEEVRYGLSLLRTARAFGADVALLDSGITHWFVMLLFKWSGMAVVPILHNALWPAGFRPAGAVNRLLWAANRLFWHNGPAAVIAVSPETARQVDEVVRRRRYPVLEIRAQFRRAYFDRIPPAPPHDARPFQVMFIGRVDRIKGVLDIPAMAKRVEAAAPGRVRWVICGRGRDLDELSATIDRLGVGGQVEARGWTSLDDLVTVYAGSHAAIVPTRSSFEEGLAMTAAEAILAGRPLVSNPVVPALEILSAAAVAGRTDDPDSHADAVLAIATDRALWERLRDACPALGEQFYDRARWGLTAVLHRALGTRKVDREV